MKKQPDKGKITALYERLSHDDERAGESVSIENQKRILEDYAQKNGFTNIRHFTDDGVRGTTFKRPGLDAMLEEIRAGNVATVIIKDQSRIGRDVVEVGLLKRTFDEYHVRFIAANDNLDTANGFDIMSIFRDVINEWHAADTSRKIKAVFKAKGNSGKPLCTNPPYGYLKDPEDKNHWIVDEEAAEVVREIFRLCIAGYGPSQIASILEKRQIEIPIYHAKRLGITLPARSDGHSPYGWDDTTITRIFTRQEYLGHTVNFKTRTKSFRDKKKLANDPSEWAVFENTHEAIIDQESFDIVQRIREGRRRVTPMGEMPILSGMLFCADCGSKLYQVRHRGWTHEQEIFICAKYRKHKGMCTPHQIHNVQVEEILLRELRLITAYAREHEEDFIQLVTRHSEKELTRQLRDSTRELEQAEERIGKLDSIIQRLYEDNVEGKISDERFAKLSASYEAEQNQLESRKAELTEFIDASKEQRLNVDSFLGMVRKYTDITELTAEIIRSFVEKIEVLKPEKVPGTRTKKQTIVIYWNFIGAVEIPVEAQEKTA